MQGIAVDDVALHHFVLFETGIDRSRTQSSGMAIRQDQTNTLLHKLVHDETTRLGRGCMVMKININDCDDANSWIFLVNCTSNLHNCNSTFSLIEI